MNVIQNIHGISGLRLTVVQEHDTAEAGRYWVRTLIVTGRNGEEIRVELFGDSPQALTLISERLDAYAGQARSCLPETQGAVDLAAEADPPRFQSGDRVTPIQSKMYIGIIATVEDASPDGLYVRFTEGNRRWFPASLFRLADPDPLTEANPTAESDPFAQTPLEKELSRLDPPADGLVSGYEGLRLADPDPLTEAAPLDSDPYAPGKEVIREGTPEYDEWIASVLPDIDPTAPM